MRPFGERLTLRTYCVGNISLTMKKITPFAATLAAALLFGTAPALAAGGMQPGPVALDDVQFNQTYTPDFTTDPGTATVAFTNTASVPATEVVFAVTSNGNPVDIFDTTGTFSPGVRVSKNFASNITAPDRDVVVLGVTYADGSVWTNPNVNIPTTNPSS
jgi:hypothetical protein